MMLHRLIPMLAVASVPRSVDFYAKLGFAVADRNEHWRWAMLACGDCRLMVDESINTNRDAMRCGVLYLYPDDIVAYHRMVRGSGLDAPAPEATFYGMTEFRIDDPDGNRLWIGQPSARPG